MGSVRLTKDSGSVWKNFHSVFWETFSIFVIGDASGTEMTYFIFNENIKFEPLIVKYF